MHISKIPHMHNSVFACAGEHHIPCGSVFLHSGVGYGTCSTSISKNCAVCSGVEILPLTKAVSLHNGMQQYSLCSIFAHLGV